MYKKDIDFDRIFDLISSMPDYFDIKQIDLSNGYHLIIEAGETQINEKQYNESLSVLNDIISDLNNSNKRLQKLDAKSLKG